MVILWHFHFSSMVISPIGEFRWCVNSRCIHQLLSLLYFEPAEGVKKCRFWTNRGGKKNADFEPADGVKKFRFSQNCRQTWQLRENAWNLVVVGYCSPRIYVEIFIALPLNLALDSFSLVCLCSILLHTHTRPHTQVTYIYIYISYMIFLQ